MWCIVWCVVCGRCMICGGMCGMCDMYMNVLCGYVVYGRSVLHCVVLAIVLLQLL